MSSMEEIFEAYDALDAVTAIYRWERHVEKAKMLVYGSVAGVIAYNIQQFDNVWAQAGTTFLGIAGGMYYRHRNNQLRNNLRREVECLVREQFFEAVGNRVRNPPLSEEVLQDKEKFKQQIRALLKE